MSNLRACPLVALLSSGNAASAADKAYAATLECKAGRASSTVIRVPAS